MLECLWVQPEENSVWIGTEEVNKQNSSRIFEIFEISLSVIVKKYMLILGWNSDRRAKNLGGLTVMDDNDGPNPYISRGIF